MALKEWAGDRRICVCGNVMSKHGETYASTGKTRFVCKGKNSCGKSGSWRIPDGASPDPYLGQDLFSLVATADNPPKVKRGKKSSRSSDPVPVKVKPDSSDAEWIPVQQVAAICQNNAPNQTILKRNGPFFRKHKAQIESGEWVRGRGKNREYHIDCVTAWLCHAGKIPPNGDKPTPKEPIPQGSKVVPITTLSQEFWENPDGSVSCSYRGAARLLGVAQPSLTEALSLGDRINGSELRETLMQHGFEGDRIDNFPASGIPDTAFAVICHYYAYDAKRTTEQAKALARAFTAVGFRVWVKQELGTTITKSDSQSPVQNIAPDAAQFAALGQKLDAIESKIPETPFEVRQYQGKLSNMQVTVEEMRKICADLGLPPIVDCNGDPSWKTYIGSGCVKSGLPIIYAIAVKWCRSQNYDYWFSVGKSKGGETVRLSPSHERIKLLTDKGYEWIALWTELIDSKARQSTIEKTLQSQLKTIWDDVWENDPEQRSRWMNGENFFGVA